jgi:hypothetical protein
VHAAAVRREELEILVACAAIDRVLNAVVAEAHLAVQVRQVVLARAQSRISSSSRWGRSSPTRSS